MRERSPLAGSCEDADSDMLRQKELLGMDDFYWLSQGERKESAACCVIMASVERPAAPLKY